VAGRAVPRALGGGDRLAGLGLLHVPAPHRPDAPWLRGVSQPGRADRAVALPAPRGPYRGGRRRG